MRRSNSLCHRVIALAAVLTCAAGIWLACDDDPQAPPVDNGPPPVGLTDPVFEYPHSEGRSITGGYVYRGAAVPSLVGKYVYADYTSRRVWALEYTDTVVSNEQLDTAPDGIAGFGVDEDGELYLCSHSGGSTTSILRLEETGGVYSVVDAFPDLTFTKPVDIRNAGDGTNRLFVVEQEGIIRTFPASDRADVTHEFLDITGSVACCGEQGLLGLAFHPDFETNGYFYVFYTTEGALRDRLSRFQVNPADSNDALEASEKILLEFNDSYDNHNGGGLCFDDDGYLYVSTGDEGSGGDPHNNAQDRTKLFGKILRLDVNQNMDVVPYHGIPGDNPLVGNTNGYREEIWAWGLRNPWRISYDETTDRIWAGDVGQRLFEEIDIIEKGKNYGWDCREGKHGYDGAEDPSSPLCPGN